MTGDGKWGYVKIWTFGSVVCFYCEWTSPSDTWSLETIATLPSSSLYPRGEVCFPMARANRGSEGKGDMYVAFTTDGSVKIRQIGGGGHQGDMIYASGCYISGS